MQKYTWPVVIAFSSVISACSSGESAITQQTEPIVGGTDAAAGAWPSTVSVVYSPSPFAPWHCGGTLIGKRWVLTAAHCVFDDTNAANYQVYVGRQDITSSAGQTIAVSQIVMHPNHPSSPEPGDGVGGDNDIALLKLSADASAPVARLITPGRVSEIAASDITTVVGWGTTSQGGSLSAKLQEVTVPVVGRSNACNDVTLYSNITDNEICIGPLAGGKDSCQGDSGGPVYIKRDNEWFVLGVTSWGFGCAQANRPGVYTFVPNYVDWVTSTADVPSQSYLPSAQLATILL